MHTLLNFIQRVGWIDDITNWFKDAFKKLFDALVELLHDLVVVFFEAIFSVLEYITDNMPVPDFLTDYSLCALIAQAGPEIGWIFNELHISECMLVLAAGYAFRMTRKVLTLFQW